MTQMLLNLIQCAIIDIAIQFERTQKNVFSKLQL